MAIEIELKAHVQNAEEVRKEIDRFAQYGYAYEKNDTYWYSRANETQASRALPGGLRIRTEKQTGNGDESRETVLVTYKSKELRDGIEVNEEHEFSISGEGAFTELLSRLGFEPGISKKKTGWSWSYTGITMELSLVDGLGWFLELEILADKKVRGGETVLEQSRKRLLDLLKKTGIPESAIEPRYYTEMLREVRGSGKNRSGN
ncbi:class IV adenylate cyclase [Breznakiella homolactica]|uniref:Class IV adenylate cyclase n=1 Tax=Breznakiella homolactica TaxID=2798577 RepID=A0A7T7XLE8_9SPIR|nr:class IV adenylate cyclase [Breznakiella homolactica]QQO08564.1 class IV adenylate cyclase [Breznakiella homolactica]